MSRDVWNPDCYGRFREERRQPFRDLVALVRPRPGMRVVDLGCGTGELTRELHETLGAAETIGIDSSAAMLARATPLAGDGLRFEQGDIATLSAAGLDLVFSNAALHWVPRHDELLARLTAAVAPGGQIAIQVPANHDHPSHRAAREVAGEAPFAAALGGYVRAKPVLEPEEYATLLHQLGWREQRVRVEIYGHPLASRDEVVEWLRATLLTDYEKRLAPELYRAFLERYRERLREAIPDVRPYYYTYRRILFWGAR